jgi:hypothetical protein
MVKVGDVIEIPLSDGRSAYAQYVHKDKMGPMIRIFDVLTDQKIPVEQLRKARLLFPPVITGLLAAIRTGLWKKIGHMPVQEFVYPNFYRIQSKWKAGIWFQERRDICDWTRIARKYAVEYYV